LRSFSRKFRKFVLDFLPNVRELAEKFCERRCEHEIVISSSGRFARIFRVLRSGSVLTSVVDPHHFDADPDSTYHPYACTDSDFFI
jgi:hypothetical protein